MGEETEPTIVEDAHGYVYVVAPDVVAATIVSIELVGEMLAQ